VADGVLPPRFDRLVRRSSRRLEDLNKRRRRRREGGANAGPRCTRFRSVARPSMEGGGSEPVQVCVAWANASAADNGTLLGPAWDAGASCPVIYSQCRRERSP